MSASSLLSHHHFSQRRERAKQSVSHRTYRLTVWNASCDRVERDIVSKPRKYDSFFIGGPAKGEIQLIQLSDARTAINVAHGWLRVTAWDILHLVRTFISFRRAYVGLGTVSLGGAGQVNRY